jgi:hypothetical protein
VEPAGHAVDDAGHAGSEAGGRVGGFAISQAGADAYVKAIDDALFDLEGVALDLQDLQQETKLGTSPDAQKISQYNMESAMGGAGTLGIVPAIDQLRTALQDARAAMDQAVKNYRAVDDASANAYRG